MAAKLVQFEIKIGHVRSKIGGYETITKCIRNRESLIHYQFKNKGIEFTSIKHSLDACRDALAKAINEKPKEYLKRVNSKS